MRGKRYKKQLLLLKDAKVKDLGFDSALDLVFSMANAKFDETIEVSGRLGIDPKQSDQYVRGTVSLPHGTGRKIVLLVFAKGVKEEEARAHGAHFVGGDELIQKIQQGWLEFDKVLATPDMMPVVSKVAKVLGPKGLMPNPKAGTVTLKIGEAVEEELKGRVQFRSDKSGNFHSIIGKKSLGLEKLRDNLNVFYESLCKSKPSGIKGEFILSFVISSTMGPSVRVSLQN